MSLSSGLGVNKSLVKVSASAGEDFPADALANASWPLMQPHWDNYVKQGGNGYIVAANLRTAMGLSLFEVADLDRTMSDAEVQVVKSCLIETGLDSLEDVASTHTTRSDLKVS